MSYTVKQVADSEQIGVSTLLDLIRSGDIIAYDISRRVGGKPSWRITEEELAAFHTQPIGYFNDKDGCRKTEFTAKDVRRWVKVVRRPIVIWTDRRLKTVVFSRRSLFSKVASPAAILKGRATACSLMRPRTYSDTFRRIGSQVVSWEYLRAPSEHCVASIKFDLIR